MVWEQGKRLQGGQYVIERVLGIGGFGITYLATDTKGQQFAIKTVNQRVQSSRDFEKSQREFFQEVQHLQKCRHRHIVGLGDVIQEGVLFCMVMEYIAGATLADYVTNRGILSEEEALLYIRQICEALIVVHNNGLLHRDINPRNIMLRSNRTEAILIDFGLAREFTPDLTQSHTAMLSDGYAPPEQYFRKRKRGAYTDVYALAATLYFMLTGKAPTPALDRNDGVRLIPAKEINQKISDRLNQAILKGMTLEAKRRPQSIQEWLKLLPVSQPETLQKPKQSNSKQKEIIVPWDMIVRASITEFFLYTLAGLLSAIYSLPNWFLFLVLVSVLLNVIYYVIIEADQMLGDRNITTILMLILYILIFPVSVFHTLNLSGYGVISIFIPLFMFLIADQFREMYLLEIEVKIRRSQAEFSNFHVSIIVILSSLCGLFLGYSSHKFITSLFVR